MFGFEARLLYLARLSKPHLASGGESNSLSLKGREMLVSAGPEVSSPLLGSKHPLYLDLWLINHQCEANVCVFVLHRKFEVQQILKSLLL